MDLRKLGEAADPKNLAGFIGDLPEMDHHPHGSDGSIETTREERHEGHYILVRTTYRIEVDGNVLPVPLALNNDGQLHCHSLPNYQFGSAIDMVKQLIDTYTEEFPLGPQPQPQPGGASGHEHHPGTGPHEH